MVLTKEQAIENHRKMWNWIADQYELGYEKSIDNLKRVYGDLFYPYKRILGNCFCCDYAGKSYDSDWIAECSKCPLKWPSDEKEGMCSDGHHFISLKNGRPIPSGLYGVLCDNDVGAFKLSKKEKVEIARMIANLPENENVQ